MKLKDFLIRTFTWWNGQTWGTYWYTRRHGEKVGTDEFGNTYYRARGHVIDPSIGPERRWVVYNGEADLSRVPPLWRGWLAHTFVLAPTEQKVATREWELPHLPNMTGTSQAYRPQGSTFAAGRRPAATGDYVAWSPESGAAPRDVPAPIAHPGTHGNALDLAKQSG